MFRVWENIESLTPEPRKLHYGLPFLRRRDPELVWFGLGFRAPIALKLDHAHRLGTLPTA